MEDWASTVASLFVLNPVALPLQPIIILFQVNSILYLLAERNLGCAQESRFSAKIRG